MKKFSGFVLALFITITTACGPNVAYVCAASAPTEEADAVEPAADASSDAAPEAAPSDASPEASPVEDAAVEADVLTTRPETPGLIHMAGTRHYAWYGRDGRKHFVPTSIEMLSWNLDESDSRAVTLEVWRDIPIESNVTMRPGTFPVRINTEDFGYAVGFGGVLHMRWNGDPNRNTSLALSGIYSNVQIVPTIAIPDAYFPNYIIGRAIEDNGGRLPDGTVFVFDQNFGDKYVAWHGTMRPFYPGAFEDNRLQDVFVVSTSSRYRDSYVMGAPVRGYEPVLAEPAGVTN